MEYLEIVTILVSLVTTIATSFTAFIIFLQYREQNKPFLKSEIRRVKERENVFGGETHYLFVENVSKNVAENILCKLKYKFNKKIEKDKFEINYLYPKEFTKEILRLEILHKNNPELFEVEERENNRKKIPKETLKIFIDVEISYGNKLLGFLKLNYRIKDSYYFKWYSLKSSSEYEKHPIFFCWNKRSKRYIYKDSRYKRGSQSIS